MRAPKRKRLRRRVMSVPPGVNLARLAKEASYEGSREHKDYPSFAGPPGLRSDASVCPRHIKDREVICGWLRSAIQRGAVGAPWESGFPRYVWYRHNDGTVFEGRLVNRGAGSYKGFPLDQDEWPKGIEEKYAWPHLRF